LENKTRWNNISLPSELVDELNEIKPAYMSISEFVRLSIRYYIDFRGKKPIFDDAVKEVPVVE